VSFDSRFDRYSLGGDASALTASEKRGLERFFGERAECFHRHGGFNFTEATTHGGLTTAQPGFFNTGLYNVDERVGFPAETQGLYEFTLEPDDMGRFRAPSLRNVALTASYMHDGTIATLEDVVRFYEAGGRNLTDGPHAGDGRKSPFKSQFVSGFELTDEERADLVAFLGTLTDTRFSAVHSPFDADP
jgi:cytochrome c peroxidase